MWANGNGGEYDDCGADGFASSIYTISVGGIGVQGNSSWFDEACSAKMVVTYVTDLEGYASVVWLFKLFPMVRAWMLISFSLLQLFMENVRHTLVEQVQQHLWQQASLP